MKVSTDNRLPLNAEKNLAFALYQVLRELSGQLNALTEGKITAVHNATTAAPTTGTYVQGDFIKNSTPTELGTAGSKYVIHGWQCVVGGTPGTWVQCRFLTGN